MKERAFYYKSMRPSSSCWEDKTQRKSIYFQLEMHAICKYGFLGLQHAIPTLVAISVFNKYPQFIMGVLAQAKNGDKQFWK